MATNKPETVDCKESLTTGLSRLFNDETTSDITLAVGEKRYAVHKVIMAASSEYFQRLFYGSQWKESSQKEIPLTETVECEAVFDTFIKYFYTGNIELCHETAPYMLTLADKYAATLKQDCITFMIKIINEGNLGKALQWIPLCNLLKAVEILDRCYAIICFNLEKISKMPEWTSLPLHDLSVILQRQDIIIPSEYNIYEAVQDWVTSQTSCTNETISVLLSLVEFKNMTAVDLGQVEQSTLATDSAPDIANQHISGAFRHLAFKAELKESDKVNISRIYTKGKALEKALFNSFNSSSSKLTPWYQNETIITRRYTWVWSCTQDMSSTSKTSFSVVVERVKVEVSEFSMDKRKHGRGVLSALGPLITKTYELSNDISGTVRVDMMICFLNPEDNIVMCINKTFAGITMPTKDGCKVVSFSMEGVLCKSDRCLISIKMF